METTIMEKKMETTIVYWGCIGIMENQMETTIMEKEMETTIGPYLVCLCRVARHPSQLFLYSQDMDL